MWAMLHILIVSFVASHFLSRIQEFDYDLPDRT